MPLPCATDDDICIATETLLLVSLIKSVLASSIIVKNEVQAFDSTMQVQHMHSYTFCTKSTNNNTYACMHTDTNIQVNTKITDMH